MRISNSCRAVLAASTLALGGCANETLTGPSPANMAPQAAMLIEGFPATHRIRMGENLLLSLKEVPIEVESIRWLSSDPRIASVTATPSVSPCGNGCAWLRGESPGTARIEALLCFVDGTCHSVNRSRACMRDASPNVDTTLSVTP